MPTPEQTPYSNEQISMFKSRALSDAILIVGGAEIDNHGRFVLTPEQLQQARDGGDLTDIQPVAEHNPAREAWLAAVVDESYLDTPDGIVLDMPTAPRAALKYEGLRYARDIYVTGRVALSGIRGIGVKELPKIETSLQPGSGFGLQLFDRPSIRDIASITDNLNEVVALVLRRSDLLKTTASLWYNRRAPVFSVQDVLDRVIRGSADPAARLNSRDDSVVLPNTKAAAQEFAAKYWEIKG